MSTKNSSDKEIAEARNEDPLTGQPGAHPVATGAGAAAAGLAGAAVGAVIGGPIGGVIGTVIGAVSGGYGGKAIGEAVDPTAEEAYWREYHSNQPFGVDEAYDDYGPAYESGYKGYATYGTDMPTFEEAERSVREDYEKNKPTVGWDKARPASRAAWERVRERQARAAAEDLSDGPTTGGNL